VTTEQLNDPTEWAAILALKEGKPIQASIGGVWFETQSYIPGAKHRPKPTPVPPGDLTWEEAKALHESGVSVDYSLNGSRWDRVFLWFNRATRNEVACAAYRRTPKSAPEPAPAPAPTAERCACGHEWGEHASKGCHHWIDNEQGYCPCILTQAAVPPEPKRMVPLDAAIDAGHKALAGFIRDLRELAEKEAKE
jgi:hypothetical protein